MNRASRWLGIALIVVSSAVTTGCFDRQELEQQAFVTSLGVDTAPNHMLDCTFRVALPKTSSSGAGAPTKEPMAAQGPVTIRARSIPEAMILANTSIERTITFSHLSVILFGEGLAKQGLEPVLQPFVRYRQFRRTMFVAVAKGSAKDVMDDDQPLLETFASRLPDSLYVTGSRVGLFPVTQLNDLVRALETPHEDLVMSIYSVNKSVASGDSSIQTGDGGVNAVGGDESRVGGNPVEWIGGALMKGDKMVDTLTGSEMLYLRMLRGNIRSTVMDMTVGPEHQSLGVYLRQEGSSEIKVHLKPKPTANIHLAFDADLVTEPSRKAKSSPLQQQSSMEAAIEQKLETDMTALLTKICKEDKTDPIPLSAAIRGQFQTFPQFAQYPWEAQLSQLNPKITVDVTIRRFGKQLQPVRSI